MTETLARPWPTCTCKPGDGTNECPYVEFCHHEWLDKRAARERLIQVLIYHQRTDDTGCACGWATLGGSFAEHVADVYEQTALIDGDGAQKQYEGQPFLDPETGSMKGGPSARIDGSDG